MRIAALVWILHAAFALAGGTPAPPIEQNIFSRFNKFNLTVFRHPREASRQGCFGNW